MRKEVKLLIENGFTEKEALKILETAHVILRVSNDPKKDIGRYYTEIVQLEEYQEEYEQATTGDEILALWERIGNEVVHNNPFSYINDEIIVNTF